MVVLSRRYGIDREVSNGLRVDLGGGIETKRYLDVLVSQVTINCLGAADN